MAQRHQVNVKDLVRIIEEDMKANQEEIKNLNNLIQDVETNNDGLSKENDTMKSTILKKKDILKELKEQEQEVSSTLREHVKIMQDKIAQQNEKAQKNMKNLSETNAELESLRQDSDQLEQKIQISNSLKSFHESCNYVNKIQDLQDAISDSKRKSADLHEFLGEQNMK